MRNVDSLELLEERVAALEKLVGNFDDIEVTKGYSTILEVSNKITNQIVENPKLASLIKELNTLKKFTNFNILNEIEDENLIKAKIELILSEEAYLKKINQDFENLQKLSKVLDNPALNDIPKIGEKIRDISAKQAQIKEGEETYSKELKEYLGVYFNAIKSVDEGMTELNQFLDQYFN